MKWYGVVHAHIHIFLILILVGGGKRPSTRWIGGWVGPRSGLDDMNKKKFLPLPGLQLRTLGRAARSQSLYRLSYRGVRMYFNISEIDIVIEVQGLETWNIC
jgi:hypothetical protein